MNMLNGSLTAAIAVWTQWDLSFAPSTLALSWELMENNVTEVTAKEAQETCNILQVLNKSNKQKNHIE